MRIRSISVVLTLSVLFGAGLVSCGSTPSDDSLGEGPPGTGKAGHNGVNPDPSSGADSGGTGDGSTGETVTPEPSPTMDIRTFDLANTTWLYSDDGYGLPFDVPMVNGAAVLEQNGFPSKYALQDVLYGDIDGDGDEDAVALISRAQDNGYKALWYIWLAQDSEVVQVKYPIAETGKCGTYVESVVPADGAATVTEYLRVPGQDDGVPCSDPGTGLKKRTVTVVEEAGEIWPVQKAPVVAWGGLCMGPAYDDTAPGIVDLWAAPTEASGVAATASPEGGAVFAQKEAPLTQRDGWALVGFRVFGVESDLGGRDMACAWAHN